MYFLTCFFSLPPLLVACKDVEVCCSVLYIILVLKRKSERQRERMWVWESVRVRTRASERATERKCVRVSVCIYMCMLVRRYVCVWCRKRERERGGMRRGWRGEGGECEIEKSMEGGREKVRVWEREREGGWPSPRTKSWNAHLYVCMCVRTTTHCNALQHTATHCAFAEIRPVTQNFLMTSEPHTWEYCYIFTYVCVLIRIQVVLLMVLYNM